MSKPVKKQIPISLINRFIEELPGDAIKENYTRQVQNACYTLVQPVRATAPKMLALSKDLFEEMEMGSLLSDENSILEVLSGNVVLDGITPYASCYGGHQFGNWAGQLGDGRAINLGEIRNSKNQYYTLQLKGAGPTPYSRNADGFAVLRSSLREYVCSEAMHYAGVPTSRALSLIATGDEVVRDMFYDGNPLPEPGAVVCRVAPSFIRFGNFEILAARQDQSLLKQLADFTIKHYFSELDRDKPDVYEKWFEKVVDTTLNMIVHWMRVGFVHGVMNTDNMSIHGITIDYGPYGFLDSYEHGFTPNTTDLPGRRYCYINQPAIAQWNLMMLANAIYSLSHQPKRLEEIVMAMPELYKTKYLKMMRQKLGWLNALPEDENLIAELEKLLNQHPADMTIFFRKLAGLKNDDRFTSVSLKNLQTNPLYESLYSTSTISDEYLNSLANWLNKYLERKQNQSQSHADSMILMNRTNPKYIFRNYLAYEAIQKVQSHDFNLLNDLLKVLKNPYDEQQDKEASFFQKRPDWAKNQPGSSMLSCSS